MSRDLEAARLADEVFLEQGQVPIEPVRIVSAAEFASVDEPGDAPLVGTDDEVLIPQGADVMLYGDGGASKTTLGIDCACHIAAGDEWLGAPVPNPAKVGLIEAEGPTGALPAQAQTKARPVGGLRDWRSPPGSGNPLGGLQLPEHPGDG